MRLLLLPLAFLIALPASGQAGPRFEDGQAQVVPAFEDAEAWIQEELWVETEFDSDGDGMMDRVHTAVVRPQQTETEGLKVPVIYETSPYFAGTAGDSPGLFWNVQHEIGETPPARTMGPDVPLRLRPGISSSHVSTWVPRGFAVVHSSSPGTGLSEGCPTVGGINESLAPKAVVDWLNGRARGFTAARGGEEVTADWSTGKVGMTGTSYNGTLPLAAATTGVEGLEAIIPIAPNTSYYHYYRSNGLVRSPGGYLGEDIDVLYDFIHSRDSDLRATCDASVRDGEMGPNLDRLTGDYNEFWAGRDYLNVVENVQAATLMAHAFNDWNVMPEHSTRISEALKARGVPVQEYFHQGGHGGPPPLAQMNRWFTRYLYDVENGVENDPKAWIVREGDERDNPTPYAAYPNPDASPVMLYPRAGQVVNDMNGVGALAPEASGGQGMATVVDNVSFGGQALSAAEWTQHRLLFVTPELAAPLHLSGTSTIRLRVASNKPAVNLSVWLVSLPWTEGRGARGGIVTRGWADPQNYVSSVEGTLTSSMPLTPGEYVDMQFYLQPDDQILAAGQQLGLLVFSSDREFTLWPQPGTELMVDLDALALELPVVGGAAALQAAMGQN
ncbi:Xaa-Pro dipeptidyl-peptidase [Rubricoccus marinus]|uniref:Xaa-Pro dipeptidyl-peptidase n=1 Tax=Rubricoccus marinus TaxID=716817 RepID=A0A259U0W1_9BACT|nr:Xaa-Pro dipeptidyl-peptidase [Rubricoccus marinus]OZC03580.1 Xaa-Pro dipeptidyl-peptidase [Rubricoccus marinus]